MKFIRFLTILVVLFLGFIWLLGLYIGPDDLSGCGPTPGEKPVCRKADAVVAVSGGDTSARAAEAIKLYENGWSDIIIFSGAAADTSGPSNAKVMKQQALNAGVPSEAIYLDETSATTEENAVATKDIFNARGIKSAIIVTSAYHTRRVGLEFDKRTTAYIRRHVAPDDSGWNAWWWLTPYGWVTAISEAARSAIISVGGIDRVNGK